MSREDERAQWSAFVRELRSLLRLSQREMAEKLGVSVAAVSRWESKDEDLARLPGNAARMLLVKIAREHGLTP